MKMVDSEDKLLSKRASENGSGNPVHHLFACHCGRVRAELLTPIEDQAVREDNCSSCVRVSCAGIRIIVSSYGGRIRANVRR
jgi:hypothetical protein